jgi:hypothetical protein
MEKPKFPRGLQKLPELEAREIYKYRVVRRGLPRIFYKEYEDKARQRRMRRPRGAARYASSPLVAFRVSDVVLFLASTAAVGILQNLSYDAVKWLVKNIRKPKEEMYGGRTRFEAVISEETYDRVRRERNPGVRALRVTTSVAERRVQRTYRLMVTLVDERGKPKPMDRD